MKRTSTFVALLVLLCGVCHGRHTQYRQVRYSPYAFSYHNSGLVPSGVRHSLHAFSYHNPGLISDYRGGSGLSYRHGSARIQTSCSPNRRRSASRGRSSISAKELREARENNGLYIIRQYLAHRGFKNVRLKHHLSMKNRTVLAAFVLPDENLIVTYRNTQALASLAEEQGFKKKAIERVEMDLADTTTAFLAKGGQVHGINASGKEQVLVALQDCVELRPDDAQPHAIMMLAKN
jgi:hypothetical protein